MRKKIDWNTYKFRASQVHKLLTGSIEQESEIDAKIKELETKRDVLVKDNPRLKWTPTNIKDLNSLIEKKKTPLFERLPKTLTTELRKIHRAETFKRNFSFTNKYVQKGISQEEEAITIYQNYRKNVLGIPTFFLNNKVRLENDWVSGEADLTDTNDFANCTEGFDTKCSWELETFPYKNDPLDQSYEVQNQVYMWLSNTNKWTTAYVLVNTTEQLLHLEKQKWYYAMGMHLENKSDEELEKSEIEYEKKAKELEIRFIFDYDRFVEKNPMHVMEHSKKEWFSNGYDMDLKDRVIEKISVRNDVLLNEIKERIELSRDYLKYLDGN